MSFALPQEAARLSYGPPAQQPRPVYISPPPPHPSQPPAPSFFHETPISQEKSTRTRGLLSKTVSRENSSHSQHSPQLQDPTYLFQLQQAAQPLPSTLDPAPPSQRNAFQPIPPILPSQNAPQDVSMEQAPGPRTSDRNDSQSHVTGGPSSSESSTTPSNTDQVQVENLTAEILKMTPPPEATYATFDTLLSAANTWALERGYAMVIGRSKKKNKAGLKKVLLACDRGGTSNHTLLPQDSPLRKRVTTSRKIGCPFGVYAVESTMEWTLKYRPDPACCVHNHGPSKSAADHPAARKLDPSAVAAVRALKEAGVSAQDTLKQIQAARPGAHLLPRDVYNARAALRRQSSTNNTSASAASSSSPTPFAPSTTPDTIVPPPTAATPSASAGPPASAPASAPPPPPAAAAGTGASLNSISPATLNSIYKRAAMTPEERFREDCRLEVAKAREELERARTEHRAELEELKRQIAEKDKMIEKFEMFIDICNGRVMMQRERLAGEMMGNAASGSGSNVVGGSGPGVPPVERANSGGSAGSVGAA